MLSFACSALVGEAVNLHVNHVMTQTSENTMLASKATRLVKGDIIPTSTAVGSDICA